MAKAGRPYAKRVPISKQKSAPWDFCLARLRMRILIFCSTKKLNDGNECTSRYTCAYADPR